MVKTWLATLCAGLLAVGFACAAQDAQPQAEQRRFIFDEGVYWARSAQEIDRRLDRIARAGFNAYVPTVWLGDGTLYPSDVVIADSAIAHSVSAFDPLRYLLKQAHARGIEVHPWVKVMARGKGHFRQYYEPGVPEHAMDVHNPAYRDFIVAIIEELVRNYPLDGLNLDYVRAMGVCSSKVCEQRYAQRHSNARLAADRLSWRVNAAAKRRLIQWQSEAVTDIVRRVHDLVDRHRPGIPISVDIHSGTDVNGSIEGRDAVRWMNAGLIQLAFDMQYAQTVNFATGDRLRARLNDPTALLVLIANYRSLGNKQVEPRTPEQVVGLLSSVSARYPGSSHGIYLYSQLTDEQIRVVGRFQGEG